MFKKIRLYFLYRKILKNNIKSLRENILANVDENIYVIKDIQLDWLCRLYTVLNFQEQTKENLDKYGYHYMDNEVKKFVKNLELELKDMGLFELYGLDKADQLDKDKVLIVIDFKLFHTTKIFNKLIIWSDRKSVV